MEIKGLAGGKDFSIVKFKDKLGYATKYNSLKDKRENIIKVVRGSQGAIRSGNFKAAEAMAKFKALNKGMTAEEARSVGKVFRQLGSMPAQSSLRQAVESAEAKKTAIKTNSSKTNDSKTAELTARAAKVAELQARPSLARINRDPGSYTNIDTYRLEKHGTGLASGSISAGKHYGVAANRGETSDKSLETRDINKSVGHERVNI